MRIGLVVDSACDLPREFLDAHKVHILPISLRIGVDMLEDARDLQATEDFYRGFFDRKSDDFSESVPYSAEQIERLFLERLVLDYDYVFCLTITPTRSAIFDNASQASRAILTKYKAVRRAAGIPERFGLAVLSTANMFAGQGVPVAEAARMIAQGCKPGEIGGRLRQVIDATHAYLVPPDLFHIYKRASRRGEKSVGWGTYALGTVLDVKPIIHFYRDTSDTTEKVRGFENGVERLFGRAEQAVKQGLLTRDLVISYGGDPDKVIDLPGYARLAQAAHIQGINLLVSTMSVTAAINVGPGAVSLGFAANDANPIRGEAA